MLGKAWDQITRVLGLAALGQSGFTVVEAEDGESALNMLADVKPDLILLDVEMPRLDGFSTCSRLRALPEHRTTPVVMMTAHDDQASIDHAYAAGATDFTTKPVNWTVLGNRLRYMLRSSEMLTELARAHDELRTATRGLAERDKTLQARSAELDEARAAQASLEATLETANVKQIALEEERGALERQSAELRSELDSRREQQSQREETLKARTKQANDAQQELADANAALAQSKAERLSLTEESKALENEVARLRAEQQRSMALAQQQRDQLAASGERLLELQTERDRLQAQRLAHDARVVVALGHRHLHVLQADPARLADAIRRKLVLEIAGRPPAIIHANAGRRPPRIDCMIGEKLLRQRYRMTD